LIEGFKFDRVEEFLMSFDDPTDPRCGDDTMLIAGDYVHLTANYLSSPQAFTSNVVDTAANFLPSLGLDFAGGFANARAGAPREVPEQAAEARLSRADRIAAHPGVVC
jgi:hypothetical protein